MTGTWTVSATHLEGVYDDHNKYYRLYECTYDGDDNRSFLIRNWGRRSAPTGQWMKDGCRGDRSISMRSHSICDEKVCKGYTVVHCAEYTLHQHAAERLRSSSPKLIDEVGAKALATAFEEQWCADVHSLADDVNGEELLAWLYPWNETLSARAPARRLRDELEGRILFLDAQRDIAVVRIDRSESAMLEATFDSVTTAAAKPEDGEQTAVVATRLWSPTSSGPYRHLSNAVRDARRLFRR